VNRIAIVQECDARAVEKRTKGLVPKGNKHKIKIRINDNDGS